MRLSGSGTLTSPSFENSAVSRYDMLMPLRNTVFVALKNASSATKLTLSYATNKHSGFTEDSSKTVEIARSDEFTAYYFNLSDTACCDGRLTSFRLQAEGEGDIIFSQLSFEQERALYEAQGEISSCVADAEGKTITVSGVVYGSCLAAHKDGELTVYETSMSDESDTPAGKTALGHVALSSLTADGDGNYPFTVQFPLYNGRLTRLSSQFLALVTVEGGSLQVSDRFYVGNFRDFGTNPYSFSLPARSVKASEFGARGDGFTNDTAAIQAAIDAVSEAGGGKVILEGGDSLYGRRYVATNVKMKDDVELVIESGAVLWQSRHADDYAYAFEYDHDGTLSGVNWTHNMHINNLPLLQAYKVSNIKITGGGKAIAFITWGTNDDDLSLEEVKNITVCDNVLISNNPVGDNNFGLLLCCSDDASQYYFIEYTDIASKLQIREFSSKNSRAPSDALPARAIFLNKQCGYLHGKCK